MFISNQNNRYFQDLNIQKQRFNNLNLIAQSQSQDKQQILDFFAQFINQSFQMIKQIKGDIYSLVNVQISQSNKKFVKIKPEFPSIIAGTKMIYNSLNRMQAVLKGYSQAKSQSKERKSRITTQPVDSRYSRNKRQYDEVIMPENEQQKDSIKLSKYVSISPPTQYFSNTQKTNFSSQKLKKENIELKAKVNLVDQLLNQNQNKNKNQKTFQHSHSNTQSMLSRQNILLRQRNVRRQSIQKRNQQCLVLVRSLMKSLSPQKIATTDGTDKKNQTIIANGLNRVRINAKNDISSKISITKLKSIQK